ncbi:T9SS type A sorting domain-containing protein [Labilibacter sediminis]|nr:T9SS type A sorting domain-containing protein [Labilibacter sediminis]
MQKTITKNRLIIGAVFVMLFCLAHKTSAQSIARQSITSYGATKTVGNSSISQTVGQPYSTKASNGNTVMQGFQQSLSIKIEKVTPEPIEELEIRVYPNPANYSIFIETVDVIEGGSVMITNAQGNVIYQQRLPENIKHELNCSAWSPGIYILKVYNSSNKQTIKKIVISK